MGSESIEASTVSKSSGGFLPPGFRFHPTDEELVLYYLKRKICGRSLKRDIIGDVDVYKWDPEELPGQSKWKTGDRQWFFFSPRDRKYPNGGRANRATMHGYWKATGKDRIITCNSRSVGIKKTLVYYEGRAPSGKRTDWVMHEYTLDEEELKRCRYVKEYYALYKVFKKSGPGPKNGEQYGAPFVEEEWADDRCLDVDAFLVHNVKQPHPICVENAVIMHGDGPRLDITNNVVGEPQLVPSLAQITPVLDEEGSRKVDLGDDRIVMDSSYEPFGLQPGSELTRLAQEASEVTLVTNNPVLEPQPLVINKDFLEMDDLIGPQPTVQNSETPVMEDLQLADFDGFYAFDLYNDSTGFGEIGQFESQQIQQPHYVNNLEYAVTGDNEIGYDLWAHDQRNDNLTATEATGNEVVDAGFDLWTYDQRNDGSMAVSTHSSGVVVDENPGNSDTRVNNHQPPETKEDDGSDSWFSSALWAFVESIPTTPASAAESSACVQRALERMSSFSRGKNGNGDGNMADSDIGSGRVRKSSRSSRGIICFSFLGVLFAILCACLGTSMEVLGPCKKIESFALACLGLFL